MHPLPRGNPGDPYNPQKDYRRRGDLGGPGRTRIPWKPNPGKLQMPGWPDRHDCAPPHPSVLQGRFYRTDRQQEECSLWNLPSKDCGPLFQCLPCPSRYPDICGVHQGTQVRRIARCDQKHDLSSGNPRPGMHSTLRIQLPPGKYG